MRSGNIFAKISYVDDIGILGSGRTVSKSVVTAQRNVDALMIWAQENIVLFDAKKSEVFQFLGCKKEEPVRISENGRIIELAKNARWSGVYLDPYFSFKHYLSIWCLKILC